MSESDQGQPKGRTAATFFIFITIMLDALAIGIVIPVMPQLIASVGHIRLDDTSTYVGIFMGVGAVAGLIVQTLLVGRAVKSLGERRCMVLGASLYVAGLCLYGLAPTGLAFWAGIPLAALGAIGGPAWSALMSRQVGAAAQGRLSGSIASLQSLSQIIGPLLFTTMFRVTISHPDGGQGPALPQGAPFYLAAVSLTAAAMLALWTTRPKPAPATA